MTIAAYSTDLTDIIDFETSATLDTEVTGYTATAKPTTSSDFPIQGTGHADAEQRATGTGSLVADYGSGVTWTSGEYVFAWGVFLAPAAVNTFALAGIALYIGADTSNGYKWTVGGNDFGRYPYGGWQNFVIDPELTTGRTNVGSGAGTTYRWFGILCNVINAISKGSPYGIDVIRYGRGEMVVINGDATAYGTFEDMATENDLNANRWGLFTYQGGSYIWKGLITLGNATVVDFRDANRNIVIENSINVNSDFNRIEINNASSNIEWTNINIQALGTVAKGEFEMIDDCTFIDDGGVFTDMSTFVYQSGYEGTGRTWRRCGLVTQGGATLDGCIFDEPSGTVGLSVDSLDDLTECVFNSDGTGHAIDLGTIAATQSITWNNTDTGYTASSSGNETILVNVSSGQTLTISVSSLAGSTPSVYNTGTGTVVVSASVAISVTVVDAINTAITTAAVRLEESNGTLVAQGDVNGSGVYATSYTGSTPLTIVLKVRSSSSGETRYVPIRTGGTIAASTGLVTTITMQVDSIVSA